MLPDHCKGVFLMTCKPKDKKKTIIMLVILVIAAAIIWVFLRADKENCLDEALTMNSNAQRVVFLNKAGWIVAPDPIEQEKVLIPSEFNDAYNSYNELQEQQGFDLEKYKGKEAEIFTYTVLNYPDYPENITANLVFVNDRLVAADINQTIENGFTVPLLSGNVADLTDKFGCSETTSCETETDVIETTASETAAVTETSSAVTEAPSAAETTAVTPHSSMR